MSVPLIEHARLLDLVSYDSETGHFHPVRLRHGVRSGKPLGHVECNGYRRLMVDGRRYLAHRLAWFYVHGEWPTLDIDHKNMSRDDNRISNLRQATGSQNHANTRAVGGGLKGAHWNRFRGYWQSYITVQGRGHFLGRFTTAEAAHEAYVAAAERFHGEFARAA